ncbi:MAG TPA: hypothetical protein VGW32_02655, partial [Pyrinomonadaceae bacterium]|nr:hypothetical protein [Pyrinomonadaceae bacterium]
MSSELNPSRAPEGDVVYRRVASTPKTPSSGPREPRFDPTLMPLLVGCALLLLFVIVLGNLSIRRVQDTSREVLMLEQQLAARAELLLQLRIALTRLDNEARDKMEAQAREELRPPFDMRLNTARNELTKLMPSLDRPPLSQLPKWQAFRRNLEAYLETTKDADNYSLNGFAQFQAVDRELNELIQDNGADQRQVFQLSEQLANAAVRSIKIWTIIAILAGLFVTAATVLAAQRRY